MTESRYSRRWRELLYEIHGDGIPRLLRNWKLLEKSIGFVVWGLAWEQVVHDLQ